MTERFRFAAAMTLGDIRWDGNSRSPKLVRQSIELGPGKAVRQRVAFRYEFNSLFPNNQIAIRERGHAAAIKQVACHWRMPAITSCALWDRRILNIDPIPASQKVQSQLALLF
jgi:hypothetical protein